MQVEGFYAGEAMEVEERGLVWVTGGRFGNAEDSCSGAPLCESRSGVVEWWGEGHDGNDGGSVCVVDEVEQSISGVIVDGDGEARCRKQDRWGLDCEQG